MPHELVLSCVHDRLSGASFEIPRARLTSEITCKACGGDSAMLKELKQNGRRVVQSGAVFAMFDEDKLRGLLKLPYQSKIRAVTEELTRQTGDVKGVRFALLVRNMESVVNTFREVRGLPPLSSKPTPAERDKEIAPLVYGSPADRAAVLRQIPSLGCLVDQLAFWIVLVECHEGRC